MEPASPARLYAAVAGALLVVLGILGFFYDASFGDLDSYEEALGALETNGWLNLFYVATGALGLLAASAAARPYALAAGLLFTALAIVGWGSGWLQLTIGLLGLAAAAGTRTERSRRPVKKRRRRSKPRAKAAGKGA
ncbi:MAG TPA: DUF4383 domain-containing protein [Solirubrobacterales bacterium]|nr:DUF4383 domain-containing protein [Solirubrobacterales bacterium]